MATNDEIMRAIGRLEGKVDSLGSMNIQATDRMNRIDQNHEDHVLEDKRVHAELHSRINKLEKKQFFVVSILSGAWALVLLGLKIAWDKLFN